MKTSTHRLLLGVPTVAALGPVVYPASAAGSLENGAGVVFTVTNDAPRRNYRTGVQVP